MLKYIINSPFFPSFSIILAESCLLVTEFLTKLCPFLPPKYQNSPSDKIRWARNVVKPTAELLNFKVRDKIVH